MRPQLSAALAAVTGRTVTDGVSEIEGAGPADGEREERRQRALGLARKAGLLPVLERAAYWRERRERRLQNARFKARRPDVVLPPLRWMHDMYAHASYRLYWRTGRDDAKTVRTILKTHLGKGPHAIAEWGCGMGRITRHLEARHEVYGFDVNRRATDWCAANLSGRYSRNGTMPPLPLDEAVLDAVLAVSVLTHISAQAHEAWLDELSRVLRPGGIAMLTTHGRPSPGQLLAEEQQAFDRGALVVRGGVREGSRIYTAFQPDSFMRALFDRSGFDLLAEPSPGFGQTLWLAKRR